MKSFAIIGAGITGLTAAFYLKRAGAAVTLFEAGSRPGGVIQSLRRDGFLAEFGPNTILETSPKIAQLVRDAGLDRAQAGQRSPAEARYVVRYRPARLRCPVRRRDSSPPRCSRSGPSWRCCASRSSRHAAMAWRKASASSWCAGSTRSFSITPLTRWWRAFTPAIPDQLSLPHAFPKLKALEDKLRLADQGPDFRRARPQKIRRSGQGPRRQVFLRRRLAGVAGHAGGGAGRRAEIEHARHRADANRPTAGEWRPAAGKRNLAR